MTHPGRNDPCPCGSGKKFKKCCLASRESSDFLFKRLRQLHSDLIPRLTHFAFDTLDPESVEDAWLDFNDHHTTEPFDPESPMNMLFMPWFLFNWLPELKLPGGKKFDEHTIAEMFLLAESENLTNDEQQLLISSNRRPYSFCEVVAVMPGVGMVLLDLLRQIEYEVTERTGSETLERGEIIYCATSEMLGMKSNVGTGPFALRPTAKRDVFDLRKWILAQSGATTITSEHLNEFEYDIRGLYLNLLQAMLSPPRLNNTDGDPMLPQTLYFELESSDTAFHALASLAKGRNRKESLNRPELQDGLVVKAEIEWLGGKPEAKKRLGGSVLLGLLKIDHKQLIVEVNSTKRAARIRKLIERRLGHAAEYKTTLIQPIESQVREMWHAGVAGDASRHGNGFVAGNSSLAVEENPEVKAMIEAAARQHWSSWFDLPVPALGDITPREAAKTQEGRELLNSLLLYYQHTAENSPDNAFRPDIPGIRRELRLD